VTGVVTGRRRAVQLAGLLLCASQVLVACGGPTGLGATVTRSAFTSEEYGVNVSPRVTNDPNPPRGGGRYQVGQPYVVRGTTYTPQEDPDYVAQGTATWYGSDFHGRRTANGEIFSANAITGAHPTLPLPSYVRVTNLDNGRSLLVRINDRGPFVHGRVIDLSHRAAELLGYVGQGMTNVQVNYVSPAPLEGDDTRMLLASLEGGYADQGNTRIADAGRPRTIAGMIGSMFSYADTGTSAASESGAVNSAQDAVTAMATTPGELTPEFAYPDEAQQEIRLRLGIFADAQAAIEIAMRFAVLGAVDEDQVTLGARTGTQLTLTRLKPGVDRADVLALARDLGLNDLVLY
jgi:rare lipoprotein A